MLSDEQNELQSIFQMTSKWATRWLVNPWRDSIGQQLYRFSPGDWLPRSVVTTPNYKRSPTSVAWLSMLYCKQRAFDACFFVQGGPLLVTNGVITPINGRKKEMGCLCYFTPYKWSYFTLHILTRLTLYPSKVRCLWIISRLLRDVYYLRRERFRRAEGGKIPS